MLMIDAVRYLLLCSEDSKREGSEDAKSGIDIDAVSRRRETALMRCAHMGAGDVAIEIAKLLIKAGADVNKTGDKDFVDFDRRTALHIAASLNNVRMAELLVENKANLEATDIDVS